MTGEMPQGSGEDPASFAQIEQQAVDLSHELIDGAATEGMPPAAEFTPVMATDAEHHEQGQKPFELSVTFNREKLADLSKRAPEGAKDVVDAVLRMPETLTFEPGLTLIVGDNGSGKSSFSKALYFARRLEEERRFGAEKLDDLEQEDGVSLRAAGPLVVELAEAMQVHGIAEGTESYTEVVDYGTLHSKGAEAMKYSERERRTASLGVDNEGRTITIAAQGGTDVPRFSATPEASEDNMFGLPGRRGLSGMKGRNKHMSSRQFMDDALAGRREVRSRIPATTEKFYVLDEPEVGLDVRRQIHELSSMIRADAGEGTVAIVPTDSVTLYQDKTLPRIDFDHPELGIHLPE